MNTSWNKHALEHHLAQTKSMTETAKHFDVSRERIRQVAMREIGRDRLIEIGIPMKGAYTTCSNCDRQIGLRRKHGRCDRCACFFTTHGKERTDELVRQIRLESHRNGRRHQPWTHCKQGHPLEGDNLYVSPKGTRYCRVCKRGRYQKALASPTYLERQRENQRTYQERNREKIRARARERYATDPEYRARMQAHDRKRRAKDRAAKQANRASRQASPQSPPLKPMETITHAAMKYPDGSIKTSDRHWKIIWRQREKRVSSVRAHQGFLTSTGRFVDRREGAKIAFEAGQTPYQHAQLFSEYVLANIEDV